MLKIAKNSDNVVISKDNKEVVVKEARSVYASTTFTILQNILRACDVPHVVVGETQDWPVNTGKDGKVFVGEYGDNVVVASCDGSDINEFYDNSLELVCDGGYAALVAVLGELSQEAFI